MQSSCPAKDSVVDAETQRQKTTLLFRNSGVAQAVNVVNAALLAYVNAALQATAGIAFAWWCLVSVIAGGRYLLARRFAAARPDAGAAMKWRRRYIGATTAMAAAWGMGIGLFMWGAHDSALLFTGAVLTGMVAGAASLLAPVPRSFLIYAALVSLPMSVAVFLQADAPQDWAFGAMSLIFLAAMLASVHYLHETLDVAIRLGLEKSRMVDDLERARAAAEAALVERGRLEEEVRRERDFAESLIDTAQAIVLVLDTGGRIVRFNQYFEDISGYRLDEVKGASWFEKFLMRGDEAKIQTLFKKALTDFRTQANINPIVAKDGRKILVEWNDNLLKDSAGNIIGLLAIGQDVTQREKLSESERLLKAAVEQSSSSIMVTDYDARIVFVNAGFTQTTGYSLEEVIGQLPRLLQSGLTPRETYRDLWATLGGGRAWRGELCNRKKNGELYWEEVTISPIVDAHGRISHYLAVKDDITQRKQVQLELQEQKNFLATILENEPESVQVIDADGTLLQMNRAGLNILEVDSVEEINAVGLSSFVLPEYRAALKEMAGRVLAGETCVLEFQVESKRGTRRWLESHSAPLRDATGRIMHRLGVTRDITRKRLAEERLALALRGADLALVDWRISDDALVLGEGWTNLLGYARDELPTHASGLLGLMSPEEGPAIREVLSRHLKGKTPFLEVEVRMRHKDGRWIWALARGMVVERSAEGRALRMTGTLMDITVRKELERKLTRLATTDPLTGVANRRRFIEQLEMELVRLKRLGEPAAFVMLDVDHFKNVNDTYGHAVGDGVLQHLAELSRRRLRRIDLFGRLGGEEFGILLPGTDEAGAYQFAEGFRRCVADTPFQDGTVSIAFTVSIGIAEFNSDDAAADSIMARADVALYRAKEGGRNRVEGSRQGAVA
jgi:diguanylate cyclase (GGDEF)-like protein/PAS domain S-box-containing protein